MGSILGQSHFPVVSERFGSYFFPMVPSYPNKRSLIHLGKVGGRQICKFLVVFRALSQGHPSPLHSKDSKSVTSPGQGIDYKATNHCFYDLSKLHLFHLEFSADTDQIRIE